MNNLILGGSIFDIKIAFMDLCAGGNAYVRKFIPTISDKKMIEEGNVSICPHRKICESYRNRIVIPLKEISSLLLVEQAYEFSDPNKKLYGVKQFYSNKEKLFMEGNIEFKEEEPFMCPYVPFHFSPAERCSCGYDVSNEKSELEAMFKRIPLCSSDSPLKTFIVEGYGKIVFTKNGFRSERIKLIKEVHVIEEALELVSVPQIFWKPIKELKFDFTIFEE